MDSYQKNTAPDFEKIREKINKADRKRRTHHKRAKQIATFGHIGFCLGLFLAGIYLFYLEMEDGSQGQLAQWYKDFCQAITVLVPEAWQKTELEYVLLISWPLVGSFVLALLGKIAGLFIHARVSGKWGDVQSDVEDAKRLRSSIQYNQKNYKVRWDEHYPDSIHMINLYNFIPWMTFLAAIAIGIFSVNNRTDVIYLMLLMPVLLTIPIALLWRLSAIIDSLLYCGHSRIGFYIELSQLNKFLAPYDEAEKKREEAEKKRKEAEERAKAAEKAARTAANRRAAAEKRDQALDAESRGLYSLAKSLFREAAEMGDSLAMDNYARHCLINGDRSEAIRWLKKCIATGEAGSECKELLRTLEYGGHVDAKYGF